MWVTEVLGGMGEDGRTLVTKSAFPDVHTLYNLGPAPEPNLTVFWSPRLPDGFKRFAIKTSIDTSAIQYKSDDLMRPKFGDDCAIACCVSAMRIGKQMQFFGARVNLPKTLLYALNGGRDEVSGDQVGPKLAPVTGDVLSYDEVMDRLDPMMDWLAKTYVNALNCIHYMHDKYCYEAIEMALHDRDVLRTLACGIAGLSHATDSLSAIKHAKVKPVRDTRGLIVDFQIDGEFPCFGNNDDQADDIAKKLVSTMMNKIRMYPSYRGATHTQSVLTITSNVVYGKATGNTPDGRRKGEPFAPGANPSNGRDTHGALAALMSVAGKIRRRAGHRQGHRRHARRDHRRRRRERRCARRRAGRGRQRSGGLPGHDRHVQQRGRRGAEHDCRPCGGSRARGKGPRRRGRDSGRGHVGRSGAGGSHPAPAPRRRRRVARRARRRRRQAAGGGRRDLSARRAVAGDRFEARARWSISPRLPIPPRPAPSPRIAAASSSSARRWRSTSCSPRAGRAAVAAGILARCWA